jgi:predicted phage-related endonuclease
VLSEADKEIRRTSLGATDIVRIVGASRYGGPHDVFLEKVLEAPVQPPKLAFRLGHFAEPMICDLIAEHFGIVHDQTPTVRHPILNWASATPDRLVIDADGVSEAKYVGLGAAREWDEDEPPEHVIIQVHWQMAVTRRKVAYVGALIGTDFKPYRVDYLDDLGQMLLEAGAKFWTDHVLPKRPPAVDGSEGAARMVRALLPAPKGPILKANEATNALAQNYFEMMHHVKQYEQRLEEQRELLMLACGDAAGIDGAGWRLRWGMRAAHEVKAYMVAARRHFDMRRTSK